MFTRRVFLKSGALAIIGTGAVPSFLTRAVFAAAPTGARRKHLVVIFQRGAADGLNIVAPYGDPRYYSLRPTIAIPRASLLDLDGFFGLHPALEPLLPLWRSRHLAIVHAAGSPDATRSHFDAQDYMESGTPGIKSTDDGWLNRALRAKPEPNATPFRAIAMGATLPRILQGSAPAVAIGNLNDFGVANHSAASGQLTSAFEAMYDHSTDSLLHGTGAETFDAVKMLKANAPSKYTPAPGANYSRGPLGDSMRQLAQLMKADLGVEVAFADIGGWDHHVNEGSVDGQLANSLRQLSQSIAAFWIDLGNLAEDTVLVTMSEFGRTAQENGNRGTDHGHGNVIFVLGGPVRGGKVYGRWPGLESHQLYEARDLAITTDFRTVLSEAVAHQLGVPNLNNKETNKVFPGFEATRTNLLQLLA
jgi:uncharacterized protein (DUF1501 family)